MNLKRCFIFLRNGSEWYRIRKEFQKDLSRPQIVVNHLESIDQIIQNFVDYCQRREDYDDFLPLLSRLFLESKFIQNTLNKFQNLF